MKVPYRDLWSVKEHTTQGGEKWWTFNYACMSRDDPPEDASAFVALLESEGIDATLEFDSELRRELSVLPLYRWCVHVSGVDVVFTDVKNGYEATITRRET